MNRRPAVPILTPTPAARAAAEAASTSPPTAAAARPPLLQLQRQIGNQQVGALLARAPQGGGPVVVDGAVEQAIESARGGGSVLDGGVRRQMEQAMGADFSGVRVHADARSDALSRALGARAFATGHDIFFRQGAYDPGASAGRELLAHELTHVVQSTGGGVRARLTVSDPGDAAEREADEVARAVMEAEQTSPAAPVGAEPRAAARSGQVHRFWQEAAEAVGGALGIPVPLPAKPFTGDVGEAPPVQTVKGGANSDFVITYDGKDPQGPGEFWPHGPPGPALGKSAQIERGRSGTIRIRIVTWWHTEGGGPYKDGTADATVTAHFTCDDDGVIVVEPATAFAPAGGGGIVTPFAQGAPVGPRLTATAGVEHAQTATQTSSKAQDRSSGQTNAGGDEKSVGVKVDGIVDLGGKKTSSQGNERKSGEQRSTSNALQQAGLERVSFTREVALVAGPRKALASGSIGAFAPNVSQVPTSGTNRLATWWGDLDPDLKQAVRNGAVGVLFTGYADDTSTALHNQRLSRDRALATQNALLGFIGKGTVTRIEAMGNARAEGEGRSNPEQRRVDFELYRIKK